MCCSPRAACRTTSQASATGNGPLPPDEPVQAGALDEFHDEVGKPSDCARIVGRDQIRVGQPASQEPLLVKPCDDLLVRSRQ